MWALLKLPRFGGASMQTITTIGLDIAKSVFQVHGVDATGQVVIRRQLKRRSVLMFLQKLPSCLVGIEAQTIGVLIRAALPRALRVAEVDIDVGRQGKSSMIRKLLAPVPSQRFVQLSW